MANFKMAKSKMIKSEMAEAKMAESKIAKPKMVDHKLLGPTFLEGQNCSWVQLFYEKHFLEKNFFGAKFCFGPTFLWIIFSAKTSLKIFLGKIKLKFFNLANPSCAG